HVSVSIYLFLLIRIPPTSTLFPYTTLFRSLFRVRELADNDEEFIATLAATFLEEVPEDLERLKKAVAAKDYYTAYQAAHKMKPRSEEHTSELQSRENLVCRLLLEKKKNNE